MLMPEYKYSQPVQEYSLKFGTFQFFDSYVIGTIDEGVDMDTGMLLEFYSLCFEVFEDRPFSIIELRTSTYSIDPSFYIKYRDLLSNIKAHAVVIAANTSATYSEYEALYIKHCHFRVFDSVGDAVNWVESV